jgi:thaumarchaeosortase
MVLLAAKLDSRRLRKVIYAAIGVIGTIFLNVVRIFIIAYYGYAYAYTGQQLDAFHNSIGEVLFPIWIVAFLAIVLHVEGRLAQTAKKDLAEESPKPRPPRSQTRLPSRPHSQRKEMT